MSLRILNAEAVSAALPHDVCIQALRATMIAVAKRDAILPLRQFIGIPHTEGKMTVMQGYLDPKTAIEDRSFGVKIVSKFPREAGSPHGTHVGAVMLFDAAEGIALAFMDGGRLTAIRTASATALATDALARKDSKTALFMGHGEEAEHHLQALLAARPLERILIWGRSPERAKAFVDKQSAPSGVTLEVAEDAHTAAGEADIICTLTSAKTPILKGAWLKPGTHVNLVGAAIATSAEADQEVVTRSAFFTDYRPSAEAQAGEWIDALAAGAITQSHMKAEIGEVLMGSHPGRSSDEAITVYKSLGVTAQDLAAAQAAFRRAEASDIGISLDW